MWFGKGNLQYSLPVEAATAPINIGGIPRMMTTAAAAKQMILAVEVELEESVL